MSTMFTCQLGFSRWPLSAIFLVKIWLLLKIALSFFIHHGYSRVIIRFLFIVYIYPSLFSFPSTFSEQGEMCRYLYEQGWTNNRCRHGGRCRARLCHPSSLQISYQHFYFRLLSLSTFTSLFFFLFMKNSNQPTFKIACEFLFISE